MMLMLAQLFRQSTGHIVMPERNQNGMLLHQSYHLDGIGGFTYS